MTESEKKARSEGWAAWFANETAETCRYPFPSRECLAWVRGHTAAEEHAEAEWGPGASLRLPCESLPEAVPQE